MVGDYRYSTGTTDNTNTATWGNANWYWQEYWPPYQPYIPTVPTIPYIPTFEMWPTVVYKCPHCRIKELKEEIKKLEKQCCCHCEDE